MAYVYGVETTSEKTDVHGARVVLFEFFLSGDKSETAGNRLGDEGEVAITQIDEEFFE